MIFSLNGSVRNHQLCLHSRCRHTESLSLLGCRLGKEGALRVTSMKKWFPIRKGGTERGRKRVCGGEEGGGAIFSVGETLGKCLTRYDESCALQFLYRRFWHWRSIPSRNYQKHLMSLQYCLLPCGTFMKV